MRAFDHTENAEQGHCHRHGIVSVYLQYISLYTSTGSTLKQVTCRDNEFKSCHYCHYCWQLYVTDRQAHHVERPYSKVLCPSDIGSKCIKKFPGKAWELPTAAHWALAVVNVGGGKRAHAPVWPLALVKYPVAA